MNSPRVWSIPDNPGPAGTTVLWDQYGERWQWRTGARHEGGWYYDDGDPYNPRWLWPELLTGRGPMTDQAPGGGP